MDLEHMSILNPHPARLPGPDLLHHLVAPASSSIALEYLQNRQVTSSFTYGKIHVLSDDLATRLSSARGGQFSGQFVVPVLARQSPELYVALLAILKAGGAFCPLSPDDPPERISFIIKDVAAQLIVASEELAHRIPQHAGVQVLPATLRDEPGSTDVQPRLRLPLPASNDLAYVMYTSGSTGAPKGVGISHRAASQALLAHDAHLPSFSRFLQFAAPTFDISVFEIFFTWHRGRTLVTTDRGELLNDLPGVLRATKVDACELTPTVVASLLRTRDRAPQLRLLLTIGEMLNEAVVREFGGHDTKESILWAMYGPTEATIHCTLQPQFSSAASVHNIGTPLDTTSCFVIEPARSPEQSSLFRILPRGEVGELAVGGHQIAQGYLHRPDQTLASFISTQYGRIYRTGDRARVNPDGTLDCLGRLSDGQVKLRGQRLELGEVEAAILRTPGCHGAVATIMASSLVVFCAVDKGTLEESIMVYAKRWLPKYMVPSVLVLLAKFPQLPSGKVDKKKLQCDYETSRAADLTEGMDAAEDLSVSDVKILEVLSKVLDMDVARSTVLASASLDSLKAISLATALRAAGFEADVAQLLSLQTAQDVCASLRPRTDTTKSEAIRIDTSRIFKELPDHVRERVDGVRPCHPLQIAMLAATAQHPQTYWNDIELEIEPGITVQKLLSALLELVSQNEILRTGFVPFDDIYAAVIFKTFDKDSFQIVDSFQELDVSGPEALLHPLRLQVMRDSDGKGDIAVGFLIQIHHAIYDGWSMDIILSDLSKLLTGNAVETRPEFSSLVQHFNRIPQKHSDDDRAFWSEYLLGWNKQPFPRLRSRPEDLSEIQICRDTLETLSTLIHQATIKTGCSVQVFLQAALALVWGGLSGGSDVVFGSVFSGRTVPIDGIEKILGPCIASMPLRIDLAQEKSPLDLLQSIKSSNRSIMEHSSLPLAEIKRAIGGLGVDSVYDVLFVYQQSLFSDRREQNLFRETRHLDRLETKLVMEAEPCRDGFRLQATYHSDTLTSDIVHQILQQWKDAFLHLLRQVPDASALFDQDQLQAKGSIFNETPITIDDGLDLAMLFEAAVDRNPDADAICFRTSFSDVTDPTTTMSYDALNGLSNQIANQLLNQGARPGDVISIIMEKSPLLYASILGIIKARCGYLPLLPSTPLSRTRDILTTGGVHICMGQGSSMTSFRSIEGIRSVEVFPDRLNSFSNHNLDISTDTSRLAYVIYTSGTTGVPKGVAVTQQNIVSNILHLGSTYPPAKRNSPRLLQACSQAFDVSVFEMFFAWHTGMCLCAATNDVLFEDVERATRDFKITHLSLTPSVAALIDPVNVPDVEFLVTAGEPMTAAVSERWGDLLWQGYGPSETTNICSVKRMNRGEYIDHLGWVFPSTSAMVLKPESLEIVPIGWVGEFCFGGDQVAAGYLKMPALTAEKFIHHPRLGRIYRSGDLGRMLPDGSLIILGRMDDQIKLRGQRIEAKEINSVITGTLMAAEAVTISVTRGGASSAQLVSFYTKGRADGDLQAEAQEIDLQVHQAIFASLYARLPSYMVPSYLVPLSCLPLTSNGKMDREFLQSCFARLSKGYLEVASRTTNDQDDSEWTAIESSIADVVSRSLDIPRIDIGRWTPFANLGLHSISAIGVARELSSSLKVRVPISALLQNPTVAQLEKVISGLVSALPDQEAPPLRFFSKSFIDEIKKAFANEGHLRLKILPCSPLQEAMLSTGQEAYTNRLTLKLRIGAERMKRCWHEMVERHEILRTCFVTTNDLEHPIAQVILEKHDLPWRQIDLKDGGIPNTTIFGAHVDLVSNPLDSMIPPFSLAAFKDEDETKLLFICHHALYDGVAMDNLLNEVQTLALGQSLPAPISYQTFLQKMLINPPDVERFWQDQLRQFKSPATLAPVHHDRALQRLHRFPLDLRYQEVQDKSRLLGVSILSLCQSAWAQVLSLCTKSTDVCFGCVMSGRTVDMDGLERLIAPCFNTLPVRKNISHHSRQLDLAKAFHRLNSSLIEYQFTPLRMIQNRIVGTEGVKLFDTLLILQLPQRALDHRVWTLEEESGDMDLPIVCEVVPCPDSDSIVVQMHYHEEVINERMSIALIDAFQGFLQLSLDHPSSMLADRNVLPSVDTLRLLDDLAARRTKEIERPSTSNIIGGNESWTELESRIREVLSGLSGVSLQKIRRDTTIYQLGLDSINAVQVASMLRDQGPSVSASDVIEHHSCRKLADHLQLARMSSSPGQDYDFKSFSERVSTQVKAKLLQDADVEAILPCTPIQCAMLASFTQSTGNYYLNMLSYAIDEGVPTEHLISGWENLRNCHPMLRTGFVPVLHGDSSFAMVRYGDIPVKGDDGRQIQLLQKINVASWKREMASRILEDLHLPPWRVAISVGSSGVSMHVLIHHALYDAQSLESMLSRLAGSLLGQEIQRFPSVEPALKKMMSLSIGAQAASQEFWESNAESTVVNKFPVMTPLCESQRTTLVHEISSSLPFSVLQRAAQEQGVTVQALLQAAWTRLLSSYLGEDSIVFGVVLSGRTLDETRDAPFPSLVTVPIVSTHHQSNRKLVSSMMEYNRKLHTHQFTSLSQIHRWLGHPAAKIFDTLLVYQKLERDLSLGSCWKRLTDDASVDYPVSIEVEPREDNAIRLGITCFSDILPMEQARLLLRQFDAIVEHLAMQPAGHENELYRRNVDVFAITPATMDTIPAPVVFLHQFVEARALSHPNDPALEFVSGFDGDVPISQTWTYKELDEMGNRVADMLQNEAPVESIVAIHFEKCPEAYFSILGILKAGCSFVALDVCAPKSRKEFIIEDSKARCLLTSSCSALDFEARCKVIRAGLQDLSHCSPQPRDLGFEFSPASTCYCLYTSGTTGTPKGCEITHENCVQAVMAFQDLFRGHWQSDSRWLQFAALHFDVSVLEQYWSWSVGITVVAATRDLILDNLVGSINRLRITHIDLTPSLAQLTHPDEVPGLCKGVFITGGEALKQEILDDWGPKAVIYNAYGPTEATIGVTMYQRVPVNGRPSNIGKQFLNVGSYVFQKGTEIPVLRGGVGELCVSGKLVGKGYLNRPELTGERFPTLSEFGERIYRTGDFVRILHDGCFDFLGRADDQVKLRGQRLEIGEINHVIRTGASDVVDVATLVMRRNDGSHKDVLVSFLVGQQVSEKERTAPRVHLEGHHEGLVDRAREACRAKLPSYMVPTYFLVLPYIPLSPNNKVEAKELKRLFEGLSAEQLLGVTARASQENSSTDAQMMRRTIDVLAEFCHIDAAKIEASTSIFDLGVDSIVALQVSLFFKDHGLEACTPALLLRNPVVAELSDALSHQTTSATMVNLVQESRQIVRASHHRHLASVCRALEVLPQDVEYLAPCSALQQGIISKSVTSETRGLYFNSFELELSETVSLEKLHASWLGLITDEAIFRTCFVKTTDGFVQVALRGQDLNRYWRERAVADDDEFGDIAAAAREEWIEMNLDDDHIRHPFGVWLVRGPGSRTKLLIHILHALYDGNSFDLMMRQVEQRYRDPEREKSPSPSFVEALCHGPLLRYDQSCAFWKTHLQHWKPSPLPRLSISRRVEARNAASSVLKVLNGRMLEAVRQGHNVTLQSVVMALWTVVLQNFLGSCNHVSIGIVVSGRSINLANVENTIGPLFNTLPFFHKPKPETSWSSVIRSCHDFNISILPFQHVPLKKIQRWCSEGRQIFDNMFVFMVEQDDSSAAGAELWEVKNGPLNHDYPLALEVTKLRNGDLQLYLVAQDHVADTATLEDIVQRFERGAESMAGNRPLQFHTDEGSYEQRRDDQSDAAFEVEERHHLELFEWNDQALSIRDAVAAATGVSLKEVTATRTMLELGLDSVDSIQLSAKLRSQGVNVSASAMMRLQTIARMMSELGAQSQLNGAAVSKTTADTAFEELTHTLWEHVESCKGIDTGNIEAVLPPTHLQESMVAGMVHSEFDWYFNHDLLEMAAAVDIQKLQQAWQRLVSQSPILRTGFLEVDDPRLDVGYCQLIYKEREIIIEQLEIESLSEIRHAIRGSKDHARGQCGRDGLFQLRFVKCRGQSYLLISMAHALFDGWSLSLLFRDLEAAYYHGDLKPRPAPGAFLRKMLVSQQKDSRFWSGYLDGATRSLIMPIEGQRSRDDVLFRREALSTKDITDMSDFCKRRKVSLQTLIQACWAAVLAHRTRSLDVIFGIVLSGRDFEGAEDLMFPTMNTVALRCILHGTSFEFLDYLEAVMMDVREHQSHPLRKMVTSEKLPVSDHFNTLCILQKTVSSKTSRPLLKSVDGSAAVEYPICVEAEATKEGLVWRVACQDRYIVEEAVDQLVLDLDRALNFVTRYEAVSLISFQGESVSICGLPSVALSSTQDSEAPSFQSERAPGSEARGEEERAVRRCLSLVSTVPEESIPAHITLYHLGLDSISALKVCSLLRKEGYHINPRDLLKATSIHQMGAATRRLANGDRVQDQDDERANISSTVWEFPPVAGIDTESLLADAGISRKDVEFMLPALPMQTYMMSAWLNSHGAVFFPEFRYLIDGPSELVHVDGVKLAWELLLAELPILRTVILATRSEELPFVQIVLTKLAISRNRGDSMKPMIHFSAFESRIEKGGVEVRLRIHHALYDGVSLPAMVRRLTEIMQGRGKVATIDDDIRQWSMCAIQPMEESARQARESFWTEYLGGVPPRHFSNNNSSSSSSSGSAPDSKQTKARVGYLKRAAVKDLGALRSLTSKHGISLQSLFLAAYAKSLIAERTTTTVTTVTEGQEQEEEKAVVFGIYLANRLTEEALPSTLPTLNLVPLRVSAACGEHSLEAVARQIQDDIHAIGSDGRASVGLWEIARWTGVKIDSFVNFFSGADECGEQSGRVSAAMLPLPESRDGVDEGGGDDDDDSIREYERMRGMETMIGGCFPPAIDVEAAVRDGALDVGVFGSRDRMSDEDAAGMVEAIVGFLA